MPIQTARVHDTNCEALKLCGSLAGLLSYVCQNVSVTCMQNVKLNNGNTV